MAVTDRMTPEGKRFFKELDELCRMEVCVGYQAGKAVNEDGVDICKIAFFNEFGTVDGAGYEVIPARPFLKQTVQNHGDDIKKAAQELAGKLAEGGSAQECLSGIGAVAVGAVQHEIDTGDFEDNKQPTIDRKGSSKPLIDTGQLRQSVHYVIREKGGGA